MTRNWQGSGPDFELSWGGGTWRLQVDGPRPGLYHAAGRLGPMLALEGLAQAGCWAPLALSGATLIGCERRFDRVEATYAPLGWGAVFVRAAWGPAGDHGIDLQVQAHALTVGQLHGFEVEVASLWPVAGEESEAASRSTRWVEPREARCAALSYDGREPDLRRLTTLPPRRDAFLCPRLVSDDQGDFAGAAQEACATNPLYAEIVHPDDISRRIREGGRTLATARTTRYALFGHDLEKGVVLRARLRGLWLPAEEGKQAAFVEMEKFLAEPLPLGT